MPSGYTHCILVKTFPEKIESTNEDLSFLLSEKLPYLQLGAIAPDLPYSQLLRITNGNEKIADYFHMDRTNQLPILVFPKIREISDLDKKAEAFSFFMGFVSHVVADGIIHPFVRDKVGDYEKNKTAHRVLEMKLDVLLLNDLTKKAGTGENLNYTDYHNQIKDPLNKDFSHVSTLMAETINLIYKTNIDKKIVEDWVDDMHDLFAIAEGENNQYYAYIPGMKDFLFPNQDEVLKNKEQYLLLKRNEANGRETNFLNRDVHFLKDCIPEFHKAFGNIALKIYKYVYENGPELSENDFPAINLDTGRELRIAEGTDLDQKVIYWG